MSAASGGQLEKRNEYAYCDQRFDQARLRSGDGCRDGGGGVAERGTTACPRTASSWGRWDRPWSGSRSWGGRIRAWDRAWRGGIWLSVWVCTCTCTGVLLSA